MAPSAADIKRLIEAAIPDAVVSVSDLRGDGNQYAIQVVSSSFQGLRRVDQHRMVFRVLENRLGDALETLNLKTSVPE